MKKFKIYKQETDKSCGVACLRSAINYYDNNYSEKDIWNKHESYINGGNIFNPILNLGVTALKFGFDVEYIGYHPIIANNNKEENLEESLKEKSKNYFEFGKYYVDKALEFLNLGGKITIDKLKLNKIKELVKENKFVLVEIRPAFVNKMSSMNDNHKVIVSGYNKRGFKILNPSDTKEYLWNFDTFLLTFYSAIPEMLIIKKK